LELYYQLVLWKKGIKNLDNSNLNAGKGDPWAGHLSASIDPSCREKVSDLSSEENFGLALPIGSENVLLTKLPSMLPE
jgi:hypothetical protein